MVQATVYSRFADADGALEADAAWSAVPLPQDASTNAQAASVATSPNPLSRLFIRPSSRSTALKEPYRLRITFCEYRNIAAWQRRPPSIAGAPEFWASESA